ncbi:hypothetical protein ACQKGJ_21790 [Pedobacter suwonensis]|uniref:hypothetical protein n=1 Tax=Pedobacter suwonensis TaxID=332999 RepID=UPI0038173347
MEKRKVILKVLEMSSSSGDQQFRDPFRSSLRSGLSVLSGLENTNGSNRHHATPNSSTYPTN